MLKKKDSIDFVFRKEKCAFPNKQIECRCRPGALDPDSPREAARSRIGAAIPSVVNLTIASFAFYAGRPS
jgi:hypothetical protein